MTEFKDKEVYFNVYCPKCKHEKDDESDPKSPCYDCLADTVNEWSHVPTFYKVKSSWDRESK